MLLGFQMRLIEEFVLENSAPAGVLFEDTLNLEEIDKRT